MCIRLLTEIQDTLILLSFHQIVMIFNVKRTNFLRHYALSLISDFNISSKIRLMEKKRRNVKYNKTYYQFTHIDFVPYSYLMLKI